MKTKRFYRRLAASVLAAGCLLLAASWGLSQAVSHGRGRHFLLARLSASFGRPVDAGRFGFSLLQGLSIEADSVSVSEDPRFGQEYFLRAGQLTATLDWAALLRGRFEFGTLSLTDPSLNLVRNPDGHWNVESWLPPAQALPASGPELGSDVGQPAGSRLLSRIVINSGRINFKLGNEKILFALVNVNGRIVQDSSGRWDLDVAADPLRASVALQQSGTLRLRGTVAGTSARLRPASLALTWEGASLADALRLARGQDYGMRGALGGEVSAELADVAPVGDAAGVEWRVSGKFHLAGIHRWDLTAHAGDPGLNLIFAGGWRPQLGQINVEHCRLETTHSQIEAVADARWSRGFDPSMRIVGSRISLEDVLAWVRAFHPGMPEEFSVAGALELGAALRGWPLRVGEATLSATGATVHFPELVAPLRVGPMSAALRGDSLALDPVSLTLPGMFPGTLSGVRVAARARGGNSGDASPAPAGVLKLQGSVGPFVSGKHPADWTYRIALSGHTTRAQDLLAMAQILGRSSGPLEKAEEWKVQGSAALQLAWSGTFRSAALSPSGTLDVRDLQLSSPVLNHPLLLSAAKVELRPGARRVTLTSARALGTTWKGTLDWDAAHPIWHFDLSADRLDAAELDRWLGPRARAGFFSRMLPFVGDFSAGGPNGARDSAINRLTARGELHVSEFDLARLDLQKIDAAVELRGRNLALRSAQADVSGGHILGDFQAQLTSNPSYLFRGQFDRVNLATLTASPVLPEGRFAGSASGDLVMAAHGVGRESLIASLSAQGDLRVRAPALRGFSGMLAPADADARIPGETRFRAADASFHFSAGVIHVDRLSLAARESVMQVQGAVDLGRRRLDLRAWSAPRGPGSGATAASDYLPERRSDRTFEHAPEASFGRQEWAIGGTLDTPSVTRQSSLADASLPAGPPSVSPPVAAPSPSLPAASLPSRR